MKDWTELSAASPGRLVYRPVPKRRLRPKEILLEAVVSGVSRATELRRFSGQTNDCIWDESSSVYTEVPARDRWPLKLGYEMVARAASCGAAVDPTILGRYVWTPLTHAEYHIADYNDVRVLPAFLNSKTPAPELAKFTTVARARVAMGAVHDSSMLLGDIVAVIGCGIVGLYVAQLAKQSGASQVFVIDANAEPLEVARKMGLQGIHRDVSITPLSLKRQINGLGPDKVFECSGNYEGLGLALAIARKQGTVVCVGTYSGEAQGLRLGDEFGKNGLSIISSMTINGCIPKGYPRWEKSRMEEYVIDLIARDLLASGKLDTKLFPYSDAARAYETAAEPVSASTIIGLTYELHR